MPTRDEIKAAGGNDVGDWGETDVDGIYDGPLDIAGEKVDLGKTPAFGSNEGDDTVSSMGELSSTGDTGNFGDIYEDEVPRAPLRRR